MAQRRRRRRGADCDTEPIPLGQTGGIDPRSVEVVDLPLGHWGQSLWSDADYRLYLSDRIASGSVALVALHLFDHHTPPYRDDSWDTLVCSTATCEQARIWEVALACGRLAAGL